MQLMRLMRKRKGAHIWPCLIEMPAHTPVIRAAHDCVTSVFPSSRDIGALHCSRCVLVSSPGLHSVLPDCSSCCCFACASYAALTPGLHPAVCLSCRRGKKQKLRAGRHSQAWPRAAWWLRGGFRIASATCDAPIKTPLTPLHTFIKTLGPPPSQQVLSTYVNRLREQGWNVWKAVQKAVDCGAAVDSEISRVVRIHVCRPHLLASSRLLQRAMLNRCRRAMMSPSSPSVSHVFHACRDLQCPLAVSSSSKASNLCIKVR